MGGLNNNNEDKFNKVLSSTKEGGGSFLASIGLNKEDVNNDNSLGGDDDFDDSQGDPHKKSDQFENSKDRGLAALGKQHKLGQQVSDDEENFDLGFASSKKDKNSNALDADLNAAGMSEDEGPMTDE